jgi:hypothetical protein
VLAGGVSLVGREELVLEWHATADSRTEKNRTGQDRTRQGTKDLVCLTSLHDQIESDKNLFRKFLTGLWAIHRCNKVEEEGVGATIFRIIFITLTILSEFWIPSTIIFILFMWIYNKPSNLLMPTIDLNKYRKEHRKRYCKAVRQKKFLKQSILLRDCHILS